MAWFCKIYSWKTRPGNLVDAMPPIPAMGGKGVVVSELVSYGGSARPARWAWQIQFNGHDKNIACYMCYMSHVTHVTCHKYQLTKILLKTQCVIYFWKAHAKYSSMVMIKMLHVTYFTCHMPQMLHVTNLKLQTIFQWPSVLYIFGKLMQNTV